MRLLVATDQWAPDVIGGSARVAADTARALARRGHEVVVLAPAQRGRPALETDGSLEIHRGIHRGPFPQTVADVAETRRLARRAGSAFDVLVAHQSTNAAGLLAARLGVPLVLVFHASVTLEQRFLRPRLSPARRVASLALAPLLVALERVAVRNAAAVVVLSEYSRRLLLGAHPEVRERVARVNGGVDLAAFGPAGARMETRRRLGIEPAGVFLLSVRRLEPRMGLEELLRAASRLREQGLDFALGIAGDGMLAGPLRELARRLGLDGCVRFLGRVSEEELRDLYAAADVFVLPTVAYEGFGMATIEALASGTPVVGTAVGATPELLEGLDPALVAASSDPADLAVAIARTVDRVDEAFRRRCAAYARSRYGWEQGILAWEAALERVADRSSGGREQLVE